VGRAAPFPIGTSEKSEVLDAIQSRHLHNLISGGNDPERVSFTRENVGKSSGDADAVKGKGKK